MIIPGNRLLIWTAALALPLLSLAGPLPEVRSIIAAALFLLLILIIVDAVISLNIPCAITANSPQRLTKNQAGNIEVELDASEELKGLSIYPQLPAEIEGESLPLHFEAPAGKSTLAIELTPRERGSLKIPAFFLQRKSRFGFWIIRSTRPVELEVQCYSDLFSEQRQVASFLKKGLLGAHQQRQIGQGREFEQLREYIPGDTYQDIHWKSTARRSHPVTKVYQIERTQEVYLLIDSSRLSRRSCNDPLDPERQSSHLERYMSAAMLLALTAEQQGDHFGFLNFSDRVNLFIPASSGKAHFSTCRNALYGLTAENNSPDFKDVATFVRSRIRKRALLIFLTSLEDPRCAQEFVQSAELLNRQHLLVVGALRPALAAPLFEGNEVHSSDDLYRSYAGQCCWQQLHELRKVLQSKNVLMDLMETDTVSTGLIQHYLDIKKRQLL